ncbi:MAG: protein-glutamate O-methyltransferase CheR [Comamonas sp.]
MIGLDASSLGRGAIERSLRQRLQACALDEEAYWELVRISPAEQRLLIESVVVPETWFFRYPESFGLLAVQARALQLRRPIGQPLRLLSLPCSSGEEPYSMAMALLDANFAEHEIQIDAMDISQRALEQALQGRYGPNAFRGDDPSIRERYFQREPDGSHRIHERLRNMLNFQHGNILDSVAPPSRTAYDLVFCRNLLIYFDRPTQLRALSHIKRWIKPDGLLFAGPAEAGMLSQQGFESLDTAHSFAFRRRTPTHAPAVPPPPAPIAARPLAPWPPTLVAARTLSPTASLTPAPSVRAKPPAKPDAATGLRQITELANAGRSAEARSACARQLAEHGPSAELYFWWGLICDGAGQAEAALHHYRKALYLEPYHARALAHLAALLATHGDHSGAARLQQRLKQQEAHDVSKS